MIAVRNQRETEYLIQWKASYISENVLNHFVPGIDHKHVPQCTYKLASQVNKTKLVKQMRLMTTNEVLSKAYNRQLHDANILFERLKEDYSCAKLS